MPSFHRTPVAVVALILMSASAGYAAARPSAELGATTTPTAGRAQGTAALEPELPAEVIAASFAPGSRWRPERAVYGTTSENDLPVTMSDGTVLRVNVTFPTDPSSGKIAQGVFPVLLTQTPYGKGTGGSTAPGSAQAPSAGAATGGANAYLAQRGYIEVVADVRGTGDSEGTWGVFDPVQTSDGVSLVNWAARLPHSDGRVGTYGPSYLGINQLLLAGSIGRNSPLKAIFPMVAADDIYRDTSFMGGLLDSEFDEAYLGLTAEGNLANPALDTASSPPAGASGAGGLTRVEADHAGGVVGYHLGFSAETLAGGPTAYEGQYWQARNPGRVLADIVANGIPAFLVGGEFDIFQRGEPLNYSGLQNAFSHRPVTAPMLPNQHVSGRYQLIDGPWEHLNGSAVDVDVLELAWFDQWLKGEPTGIGSTPTPLHYYDLGTGSWDETTTYPFAGSRAERLYLSRRSLTSTPPTTASAGADTLAWSGGGSPCSRPVDQWSMGGLSIASAAAGVTAPCAGNDRPSDDNPSSSVSYTSAPLRSAQRIAGPMSATLYASATTAETAWVVEVEDISPDGTATPLTEGALLGSLRALDTSRSWRTPDGGFLIPYHPYTQASAQPIAPRQLTRYDVEIFPTFVTIPAGHAIRVTISSADSPHLSATMPELAALQGGVYTLERSPAAASFIEMAVQSGQ